MAKNRKSAQEKALKMLESQLLTGTKPSKYEQIINNKKVLRTSDDREPMTEDDKANKIKAINFVKKKLHLI